MNRVDNPVFTVPISTSTSDLKDVRGTLAGLIFPSAMTSTALTFEVSVDGVTFVGLVNDDGTAYSVTVTASKYTALNYLKFLGARHIRLKTGSTELAARTIIGAVYHG